MTKFPDTINFEGDDGTGKLTAALAFAAETIRHTDRTVLFISHPNYFGPGWFIRMMNRGKADAVLGQLGGVDLTKTRAAAYALDRVFSIIMLKAWKQQNPDSIIVSDRGPLSNTVTVGIMLGNGIISEQQVPYFINNFIPNLEPELNQILGRSESILLATEAPNDTAIGSGIREALDTYESMPDRTPVFNSYQRMIKAEPVITKTTEGWVDPYQTASTILSRFGVETDGSPSLSASHRLWDYYEQGKFKAMGPDVLLKVLFGPGVEEYVLGVPYMWDHMAYWQNAILMNLGEENYKTKDAIIDNSERIVAEGMLQIMNDYPVLNAEIPSEASAAMHRLLTDFPILTKVISAALEGRGAGFINFINQIASLSKES